MIRLSSSFKLALFQTANITFLPFFLSNPQVLLITPGVHQGWYPFDSTCTTESAAGEAAAQSLVLPKGRPLLGAGAMEPPPDLSWSSFYIILCVYRSCLAIAIGSATAGSIFQGSWAGEVYWPGFDFILMVWAFTLLDHRALRPSWVGFRDLPRNESLIILLFQVVIFYTEGSLSLFP